MSKLPKLPWPLHSRRARKLGGTHDLGQRDPRLRVCKSHDSVGVILASVETPWFHMQGFVILDALILGFWLFWLFQLGRMALAGLVYDLTRVTWRPMGTGCRKRGEERGQVEYTYTRLQTLRRLRHPDNQSLFYHTIRQVSILMKSYVEQGSR